MKIRVLGVLFLILLQGASLIAQDYTAEKSTQIVTDDGQRFYVHTVKKGNTIYNISKTYQVPSNIILSQNPNLADGLRLGMELKIPIVESKSEDFIYHIVKKKETIYQISKIYNVSVNDIEGLNQIKNNEISPGQYLKIPSLYVNSNEAFVNTEAIDTEKNKKIDDNKYAVYKVQPKETLFNISKRFGISIDALMYLNDLSKTNISSGQLLLIP
ncbi:MAG: LysM peptidoglycan-binding domain-containing protein, partial [Bacteroidales bacterium]|nr:LysM peptidoglycan-binding domain-containing protein [Bacteroidales bacterium]